MAKLLIIFFCLFGLVAGDNKFILSWLSQLLNALGANFLDPASPTPLAVNNLGVPDPANAAYYVLFAFAANCDVGLTSWTCGYCKQTGPNVRYVSEVNDQTLDLLAFFAIDDSRQEIVLSFRGTWNVPNAVLDGRFVPIKFGNSSGIKVASGFYAATKALYPGVISGLSDLIQSNPDYKVVITGHSLGGAEAALTTFLIHYNNLFNETAFELYTYGEPRQGNQAYATYFNSLNVPAARVVNRADGVPHLGYPAALGYFHHQNEVWLVGNTVTSCNRGLYEDPACSNSLGPLYSVIDHFTYYGLDALQCAGEEPLSLVLQFVVNLKPYIPKGLVSLLLANQINISAAVNTIVGALSPLLGK